jgi:UDP-glucose 4-epimerase
MRCLVTGGAGFIGSNLVDRLLSEGHEVDVVDDLSTGRLSNLGEARRSGGVTIHQMDVRDERVRALIERCQPEVIFHLAAQSDLRRSVTDPVLDASVNIIGTLHVLEAARSTGTQRVVAAASGGTLYGEPDEAEIPSLEASPHRPRSPYGVSKKAMVDYLVAYRALHGLEFMALALANVYGPRQDPHGEAGVVAIFSEQLLAGEGVTIYGDGHQTRDFVFVDDVVDAFVRAASRSGGLLVNIGTGRELSVNELYATMAAITGEAEPPRYVPARPGELLRSCLDVGRAAMQLEWRAWTSFDEGARLTIEAFQGSHQGER